MRRRKFTRVSAQQLDTEAFHDLLGIFLTHICAGNMSTATQLLGMSRPTINKWRSNPPKQAWWIVTLTHIMDQAITELLASTRKTERQAAVTAREQMMPYRQRSRKALEANLELEEVVGTTPCRRHILTMLNEHGQVSTRMLRKPAHCGGFSQSQIKRALASFDGELDKETRGFGEDKVTYYRLP
jgi:hypothetical protein